MTSCSKYIQHKPHSPAMFMPIPSSLCSDEHPNDANLFKILQP